MYMRGFTIHVLVLVGWFPSGCMACTLLGKTSKRLFLELIMLKCSPDVMYIQQTVACGRGRLVSALTIIVLCMRGFTVDILVLV